MCLYDKIIISLTVLEASKLCSFFSRQPIWPLTRAKARFLYSKNSRWQCLGRDKMRPTQRLLRIGRLLNRLLDHQFRGHALEVQAKDHLGFFYFRII